ncbi:CBS domain-containing protein [Halorussus ruber]|uniref:CBS domain-containing protein n=1 Tax=Halorussus ruber TaxID=1126238 RepID=UPI0010926DC1|nr:CBS domain-containing protein [Halorussus ruber]
MFVRDVMTETVVTVESDSSIQQTATQMLREDVGSIIVTHEGTPAGIVTKSDILYAGVASGKPYDQIPLSTVVNYPVVTVGPDATLREAVEMMKENSVKHLPVTAHGELRGIVTTTDVAAHHQRAFDDVCEMRRECREQRERRELTAIDRDRPVESDAESDAGSDIGSDAGSNTESDAEVDRATGDF